MFDAVFAVFSGHVLPLSRHQEAYFTLQTPLLSVLQSSHRPPDAASSADQKTTVDAVTHSVRPGRPLYITMYSKAN